jgi:hypothetical protein
MKLMPAILFVGAGVVIGVVATAASTGAAGEELDPVKVAPTTHKLLFENQYVKVIEAKIPPGVHDAKHGHKKGVLVFLADYDVKMTLFPSGETKLVHRTAGTAVWSDPLVHETVNVGKTASDAIRIEIKDPSSAK